MAHVSEGVLDAQKNPGDRHLIEVVTTLQAGGSVAAGEITTSTMEVVFGPQWRAIRDLVRSIADLSANPSGADLSVLAGDPVAHRGDDVVFDDDRVAAYAAWDAGQEDRRLGEMGNAHNAVTAAIQPLLDRIMFNVVDAMTAVSSWDLAQADGEYTVAHRSLLIQQWAAASGLPEGLVDGQP